MSHNQSFFRDFKFIGITRDWIFITKVKSLRTLTSSRIWRTWCRMQRRRKRRWQSRCGRLPRTPRTRVHSPVLLLRRLSPSCWPAQEFESSPRYLQAEKQSARRRSTPPAMSSSTTSTTSAASSGEDTRLPSHHEFHRVEISLLIIYSPVCRWRSHWRCSRGGRRE